MKYIVCHQPGTLLAKMRPIPTYDADEVLITIKRIGICGTDLHAFTGDQPFFQYPRILGHELSGEVSAVGNNVKHVKEGDKVVIMPYVTCGRCIACRNGKTNCCTSMQVLGVHCDGGMQEQYVINGKLLKQANHLRHDEIAIVEPLAIGAHAVRRAGVRPDQTVVVVGCGPIGLGILHFAKQRGARVIGIDMVEDRLSYAKRELAADQVLIGSDDPAGKVAEITAGEMASVVYDATGNKKALEFGIKYLAHGGTYALVGIVKDQLSFYHPEIQAKETSLLCSRNATWEDFETVLNSVGSGRFPTDSYITHRVQFDQIIDAFPSWLSPSAGVIKAMATLDD